MPNSGALVQLAARGNATPEMQVRRLCAPPFGNLVPSVTRSRLQYGSEIYPRRKENKRVMPKKQPVWFILVIRITATLMVVMVWIIRRPRQKIGGVLFSENLL
jgi:hypothetical protein